MVNTFAFVLLGAYMVVKLRSCDTGGCEVLTCSKLSYLPNRRSFVILLLCPVLRRVGLNSGWPDAVLSVVAGLKGVVQGKGWLWHLWQDIIG